MMFRRREHRNPDGLTYDEFKEKHADLGNLAMLLWFFGIRPEELKKALHVLNEKY